MRRAITDDRGVSREPSSFRRNDVTAQRTVAADALNGLNAGEITLANTALNSNSDPNAFARYGAPLEHQAPRQLRLGAGLQR